ncbi:squalene--hopene cyclase [Peribacillus deserti]|uniref:Squalene--hopene cyclase n=1 Tax=Peribacillus deserti TaxID=673318 RepID=A0A2N5LZG3_9BACI|nr:squalene--hopene cyclase [Peribacillus deserti]PLT27481.1 squalene--hopene cyclase [Peribacillus deserti]
MVWVQSEIDRLIGVLEKDQSKDGSWDYPFETGLITDAYMIILMKLLEQDDEPLIESAAARIWSRQEANGAWKLFHDEPDGNLSLTIECYYALLYSGKRKKTDQQMRLAKTFILSKGGLKKASMYTKFLLAMTGQFKWPAIFPVPLEAVLLPSSFFINMYDISVFGRSNLIPLLLLGNKKFQLKTDAAPNLGDLYLTRKDEEDWEEFRSGEIKSLFHMITYGVKALIGIPRYLHPLAIEAVKRYMFGRLEADGTLYNYFSSTFYMIMALLSLGYSKTDPVITKALNGLKTMACTIHNKVHFQYTTANVWNTSLISYALQQAGRSPDSSAVRRANNYLLSRQHYKYGDWIIHNPDASPGGWGFSDLNSINPDVDDTTASLRALHILKPEYQQAWTRGLAYTLSMQNQDGGWPAFEKNVNKKFLHLLPIQGAEYILADPSTPDLTGRTLEFLGRYVNLKIPDERIDRGVTWLLQNQKKNGSWYGRWGICYIFGTWAALTGLAAAGISSSHPAIKKAAGWLLAIQNEDGGWGESCLSDIQRKYVPLGASTLTHTAWAVDALISVSDKPVPEIDKAIRFLIREGKSEGWTNQYPAGQGMANFFYIHYHSYRYVFPLLALSHYKHKYIT